MVDDLNIPPENSAKIRLAIADDHLLFRRGMITMMEEISWLDVVIEAENGEGLIAALEKQVADIVLLDLEMGRLSGMQTLDLIKEKFPLTRVLIISMYAQEKFVIHLMEKGANGYLSKDSDFEEVVTAIKRIMEKGMYFSGDVSQILLNNLNKRRPAPPKFGPGVDLSRREREILKLICQEQTTREIADTMNLSPRTIEGHRNNLLRKLKAKNIAGLVAFAARQGWLEDWRR